MLNTILIMMAITGAYISLSLPEEANDKKKEHITNWTYTKE